MSPKGNHHEVLKAALLNHWIRRLPDAIRLIPETTFRLTPDTYLEPDFVFYDKATTLKGLNGQTALLVVEIADSSFAYDMGRKAALYATFGIRELWVIYAVRLERRHSPGAVGGGLSRHSRRARRSGTLTWLRAGACRYARGARP